MPSMPNVKPTSVLHEILAWSSARPGWQRDALRRIVANGGINEADLRELEQICKAKHKVTSSNAASIVVQPLSLVNLPPAPGTGESVSLVSIGNLKHVNRLPSDQVLPFGESPGLTVIYGDNGSGKSGYARVIKKACRARGAPPVIRSNVFAASSAERASASIEFAVAGKNVSNMWTDGVASDPRLGNVFVFDASSASNYLNEDSPAVFTPHGLDVLPMLSKTCDAIRDRLQDEVKKVSASITGIAANWKFDAATRVGKLVENLSATTKESDVDTLAGLDPEQTRRLQDLSEALKADPLQKAKETRAAAARLDAFAAKVADTAGALAVEKVEELRLLVDEAKCADEAAKAFAASRFDSSFLIGTGTQVWRTLWDSARSFSLSSAYLDQKFPFIGTAARCVLCQQDLESKAVQRLVAFEEFCRDKSQQIAKESASRLKDAKDALAKINTLVPELEKLDADLVVMTSEQRAAIAAFVNHADERLAVLKKNVTEQVWKVPCAIPGSAETWIRHASAALEIRAKIEQSAHDQATREKLMQERSDLEAREWLVRVKTDVLEQIERHKLIHKLKECLKDTATTAITTKSTELTKLFVTDAFAERFQTEAKALGLRTLEVTLKAVQGKKGETRFGLRLEATTGHRVAEIASEGEQRCVALAAFMAELSQASHRSSLVFDDPVSSLDHWHRERIANRLVDESKIRQVIVFTHDAVFLNDLHSNAARSGVVADICHLEWSGSTPGKYVKGLPWDLKTVEDRFDKLEKEQKAIANAWNPVPNEDNIQSMRRSYSWLRATLERMVEKEIFSDVVFRFRSYVDIKKLDGVVGFASSECAELQRLVQRCHGVTDAHDPAQAKQAAVPMPADLAADIAAAQKLLADIRIRRKVTKEVPVVPQSQPGTH